MRHAIFFKKSAICETTNLIDFQVSETDHEAFIEKVQEVRDTLISIDAIDMARWLRLEYAFSTHQAEAGRKERAMCLLQDMLKLSEEHFGRNTNPRVVVGGELAVLLIQQGRHDESIALLKELCERGSTLGFEDRFNYISIQQKLAMAYLAAGENKLAMEMLERLLSDFQSQDKTGLEDIATHERISPSGSEKTSSFRGMQKP